MATIREAAQSLNVQPNKLLKELKKKYPAESWTLDSELPDEFIEAAKAHAQDYAEASGTTLPKGEITTLDGAALDNKVLLESLEYGVLEAISELRTSNLINTAQLDAVADIQTYEATYSEVWAKYYQKKQATSEQNRQSRNQDKAKQLIELNNDLGNRQGELIRMGEQFASIREQSRDKTQTLLDALLK